VPPYSVLGRQRWPGWYLLVEGLFWFVGIGILAVGHAERIPNNAS